jgi:S-formylglutathione hydrolase FrmB
MKHTFQQMALGLTGAGLLLLIDPAPLRAAPPVPAPSQDSHGIHLDDWDPVDLGSGPSERLWEAKVRTPAIFENGSSIPLKLRILFPADYMTQAAQRYPVLFLLHGGTGSYEDWSKLEADAGSVQSVLDRTPFNVIVVMPEGGRSGWYSDWFGETDGGFTPLWETFHVDQLVPWVDGNFRTLATRANRSIAGLSMGGLGALKYAGANPDRFSAVGSFSGAVNLLYEPAQDTISNSMWFYGATVVDEGFSDTDYRVTFPGTNPEEEETLRMINLFGEPVAGDWPHANPVAMAATYANHAIKVGLYSGRSLVWGDMGEQEIADMNDLLHEKLETNHVNYRYCSGFGKHHFSYWREDLHDFLYYVYGSERDTCTLNSGWTKRGD